MSREEIKDKQLYYTIVSGSFRVQVPQDSPDAVRRDWKSADGTKSGTKYERVINALFGYIEDVQFRDGEYGMQVYITLDENEDGEKPVIALATASREAEDFLKKLPNIDLRKEVRLRPFNFEGSEGDEVRGMEVMQPDKEGNFKVKITNYFRDTEKKVNINDFPNPEGDTDDYSKDDWKIYFLQARKFLIDYTKENIQRKIAEAILDRHTSIPTSKEQEDRMNEYPTEDISPDSIPF
jgi:hypothetical protein